MKEEAIVVAIIPDRNGPLQEGEGLVILARRQIDLYQHRLGAPGKAGLLLEFVGLETDPFGVVIALLEHVHRGHIVQGGGDVLSTWSCWPILSTSTKYPRALSVFPPASHTYAETIQARSDPRGVVNPCGIYSASSKCASALSY